MADGATVPPDVAARLARVRLLVMDVDGTLTDGGVFYDDAGREMKRFHIHDGLGIVLARFGGLDVAWMTGRASPLVERRARELGVAALLQGVRDKAASLRDLAASRGLPLDAAGFLGDDLNDLPALRLAGAALAPADADPRVRAEAHLVTDRPGGHGAAREAVEAVLRARGGLDDSVSAYLASLSAEPSPRPVH
jgi:3-deoxy-D-manno-octulosonate 8-phosphate phosphatase (KDO 8-P phosphatase)